MKFEKPSDRIILALDVPTVQEASWLVGQFGTMVGGYKVGLELMMSVLMQLADRNEDYALRVMLGWRELLRALSGLIFWDGKFNDIPNTVAAATHAVSACEHVRWLDVHASGGIDMLRRAAACKGRSKLVAVTVLTSLSQTDSYGIFGDAVENKVVQFAQHAQEAGADGIVCSPQELQAIKTAAPRLFTIVPGTRSAGENLHDQKRVMTPGEAVKAGADYLVIGRELTQAISKVNALKRIVGDIAAAEAAI